MFHGNGILLFLLLQTSNDLSLAFLQPTITTITSTVGFGESIGRHKQGKYGIKKTPAVLQSLTGTSNTIYPTAICNQGYSRSHLSLKPRRFSSTDICNAAASSCLFVPRRHHHRRFNHQYLETLSKKRSAMILSRHFQSTMAGSDGIDSSNSHRKGVVRRVFNGSFGLVWKVWIFVLKLVLLKPFRSVPPGEENSNDGSKVTSFDQCESITQVENLTHESNSEGPTMNTITAATIAPSVNNNSINKSQLVPSTTQSSVVVIATKEPPLLTIPDEEDLKAKQMSTIPASVNGALPKGQRWAVSSPEIDFTAKWQIIVDDKFKEEYDKYLLNLGQPAIVRSVAVSIVEMTIEEITQKNEGRELTIKGRNLRGVWDRTLIASGSDYEDHHEEGKEHLSFELITADREKVQAEAWWEENGTVHRSILRGGKKYGGGDFESKRFLEDDGNILVCESVFHTREEGRENPSITWRFKRV